MNTDDTKGEEVEQATTQEPVASEQSAEQETGVPPTIKRGLIIGSITAAAASLTLIGIAVSRFLKRKRANVN